MEGSYATGALRVSGHVDKKNIEFARKSLGKVTLFFFSFLIFQKGSFGEIFCGKINGEGPEIAVKELKMDSSYYLSQIQEEASKICQIYEKSLVIELLSDKLARCPTEKKSLIKLLSKINSVAMETTDKPLETLTTEAVERLSYFQKVKTYGFFDLFIF